MLRRVVVAVGMAVLLAGCAAPPPQKLPPIQIADPFDAQQAQRMLTAGPGSVRGSALLRQSGGGVVTCAGNEVFLVPATAYASRRYMYFFGSSDGGFRSAREPIEFTPEPPEFQIHTRRTLCDAQGYFEFDRIAVGTFYIVTTVQWRVGYVVQGGRLMKPVTITGPDRISVVLAR